jgi:hypothetical protein
MIKSFYDILGSDFICAHTYNTTVAYSLHRRIRSLNYRSIKVVVHLQYKGCNFKFLPLTVVVQQRLDKGMWMWGAASNRMSSSAGILVG